MRCLVTGASGFLGRHCVSALAEAGHEVVALSRSGTRPEGAAAVRCDLLDAAATSRALEEARAEVLMHLAWHADPRDRWHSLANLDWVTASLSLARAFAAAGGRRFVFAGSCAEYDWSHETLSEEETPLRPASLYGAAKVSVGIALSAAAPALGMGVAWPRIFFCYGPGEPRGRLLGDLLAGLAAGETVDCTDGLQQRDFLHASDVGAALALIAAQDVDGPVNVGSGRAVAVRELIQTAARIAGRPSLVRLGAKPRAPGDPPRLVADTARLAALGFRPRFDLESGLRHAVDAFRAQVA